MSSRPFAADVARENPTIVKSLDCHFGRDRGVLVCSEVRAVPSGRRLRRTLSAVFIACFRVCRELWSGCCRLSRASPAENARSVEPPRPHWSNQPRGGGECLCGRYVSAP